METPVFDKLVDVYLGAKERYSDVVIDLYMEKHMEELKEEISTFPGFKERVGSFDNI